MSAFTFLVAVFLLFASAVCGAQQTNITSIASTQGPGTIMYPPTASISFTVDYESNCTTPTIVLSYTAACSPRPSNISCSTLSTTNISISQATVNYTCGISFTGANTPTAGNDFCQLLLVVSCGGTPVQLDVGRVLSGVPRISTSASTPSYALASSSQNVEITISGSNFATTSEFGSGDASLSWQWLNEVTGSPCANPSPAPSCLVTFASASQLRCTFGASNFTVQRDGCRASLSGFSRYGIDAILDAVPSVLTIASLPQLNSVSTTLQGLIPDVFRRVNLTIVGSNLPRINEAYKARLTLSGATKNATAMPGVDQDCVKAILSTTGTSMQCEVSFASFSSDPVIVSFVISRFQIADSAQTAVAHVLPNGPPNVNAPSTVPSLVLSGIQTAVMFTAQFPPTATDVAGAVNFAVDACPSVTADCSNALATLPNMRCLLTRTNGQTPTDCNVTITISRYGFSGSSSVVARSLRSVPIITDVSPQPALLFTSPVVEITVSGQAFTSTPSLGGANPSLNLRVEGGNTNYTCVTTFVSETQIRCNATFASTFDGTRLLVSVRRFELSSAEAGPITVSHPPKITIPSPLSGLGTTASIITIAGSAFPIVSDGAGASAAAVYVNRDELVGGQNCNYIGETANLTITLSSRTQLTMRPLADLVPDSNCAIRLSVTKFSMSDVQVVSFIFFGAAITTVSNAPDAVPPVTSTPIASLGLMIADVPSGTTSGTFSFRAIDSATRTMNTTTISPTCSVSRSNVSPRISSWTCSSYSLNTAAVNYDRILQVRLSGATTTDWADVSIIPGTPLPVLDQIFQVGGTNQLVSVSAHSGFPTSASEPGLTLSFQLLAPPGVTGLSCPSNTFAISSISVPNPGITLTGIFPNTGPTWDSCDARLSLGRYDGKASFGGKVGTFLLTPTLTTSSEAIQPVMTQNFWRLPGLQIDGLYLPRSYQPMPTISLVSSTTTCLQSISPICDQPRVVINGTRMSCDVVTTISTAEEDLTAIDGCSILARVSRTSAIVSDLAQVARIVLPPQFSRNGTSEPPVTGIFYSFNATGRYLAADSDGLESFWNFTGSGAAGCSAKAAALSCFSEIRDSSRRWNLCTLQISSDLNGCSLNATLNKLGSASSTFILGLVRSSSAPSSAPFSEPSPRSFLVYISGSATPTASQLTSIGQGIASVLGVPSSSVSVALRPLNKREVQATYLLNATLSGVAGVAAYDALASTNLQNQVLQSIATSTGGTFSGSAFSFTVVPPAPVSPPQAAAPRAAPQAATSTPTGQSAVVPVSVIPPQSGNSAAPVLGASGTPAGNSGPAPQAGASQAADGDGSSVVGAVVGAIVAIAAIIAIGIVVLKLRNRSSRDKDSKDSSTYASINANRTTSNGSVARSTTTTSDASSVNRTTPRDNYDGFGEDNLPVDEMSDKLTHMLQTEFDSKWYIAFSDIKFIKMLGRGAYGTVHRAKWNGTPVAVKQTLALQIDADAILEFKREAKLLLNLQPHPNVVTVFGVSIRNGSLFLIMEYASLGSLEDFWTRDGQKLTVGRKVRMLSSIARGMAHLHQNGIIHRDIAARNILVGKGYVPKITDFGMSRTLSNAAEQGKTASNIGPIKSMAPESLRDRVYSSKTDVYSFGILIYEILTEKPPFAEMDLLAAASAIRDHHKTPCISRSFPAEVRQVARDCWNRDPARRPDMKQIAERLSAIAENIPDAEWSDTDESGGMTDTFAAGKHSNS